MRNKRIAIVGTRGVPARYGGFETFAEELGARLVERGFEVTVFCEMTHGTVQPTEYRGMSLEYAKARRLGALTTIVVDIAVLWSARKRFDVVYMLGYGASVFCFIPRLHGAEVWINMDGVEWQRSKWSWMARVYLRMMESIAMRTPDRIIADAFAIESHLRSRHRKVPRCSVIPYGAEIVTSAPPVALLDEWRVKACDYYIVVCRLEPENHVLEILTGLVASSTKHSLLVVGDCQANTPYVRQLRLVKDRRVRLIGAVYDKVRLNALRYHAKGYFHGHSVGGTNPSLLEAMASGNAIIAHDNVFNREVAAEAAMYFRCPGEIPAVLETLEMDANGLEHMRASGIQRVKTNYSWHLVADRYEQLLRSQ